MNELKKVRQQFFSVFYLKQLDYLLFSDPDEFEKFGQQNFNEDFFMTLKEFLINNIDNNKYPKEAYDNLRKLFIYIESLGIQEDLKNDYNEVVELYLKLKDRNSFEKFYEDYIDRFQKPLNRDNMIVYKDFHVDCIRYDYEVMIYFLSLIENDDYGISEDNFTFNEKFLYSLNLIINKYPKFLLDEIIKKSIIQILAYPVNNMSDQLNFRSYFIAKNNTENKERYCNYLKLSADLITKIDSYKLENKFNENDFENKYMTIFLERYIIRGEKININFENTMLLESLYWLIDYYIYNCIVSSKIKHRIINLLSEFKEVNINQNPEFKQKLNMYLVKLNQCETNDDNYLKYYQAIKLDKKEINEMKKDYKETNDLTDILEFLKTISFDFNVMESLICTDQEFESNYKEMLAYNQEFICSLRRLYNECGGIFYNKKIFQRINEIMQLTIKLYKDDIIGDRKHYKDTKTMLKKINDIYKRR